MASSSSSPDGDSTPPRHPVKRPRGTPTGMTPKQPEKKTSETDTLQGLPLQRSSRRQLSYTEVPTPNPVSSRAHDTWKAKESKALIEYLTIKGLDGTQWYQGRNPDFWKNASIYIQRQMQQEHQQKRSGK